MPTAEYSSVTCTFSMSRLAIRFPDVARRSPAISTPPAKVQATIVVPCGTPRSPAPGATFRWGSSSGACSRRKSENDDVADEKYAAGSAGPEMPLVLSIRAQKSHLCEPGRPEPRAATGHARPRPPAERSARARRPSGLLAALLHVGPDEVLGVLLEHVVDLVQDRVHVLAELFAPL